MIFKKFMKEFATEIKGQFLEYDEQKSVIIVPLGGKRFQAVQGYIKSNLNSHRKNISFSSKVCSLMPGLNLEELLRINHKHCYARFCIWGDDLMVEACVGMPVVTEPLMKEIILEVAAMADEWEQKLTDQDQF